MRCSQGLDDSRISASSNGRFVTYSTDATHLDPAVSNYGGGQENVFVRDMLAPYSRLLNLKNGTIDTAGDSDAANAAIDAAGRKVVFASDADDLTATADNNGDFDIFECDVPTFTIGQVTILPLAPDVLAAVYEANARRVYPALDRRLTAQGR